MDYTPMERDFPTDTLLDLDTRLDDGGRRILKALYLYYFNDMRTAAEQRGDDQFSDMSPTEIIDCLERLRQHGLVALVRDGDGVKLEFPGSNGTLPCSMRGPSRAQRRRQLRSRPQGRSRAR